MKKTARENAPSGDPAADRQACCALVDAALAPILDKYKAEHILWALESARVRLVSAARSNCMASLDCPESTSKPGFYERESRWAPNRAHKNGVNGAKKLLR